MTPSEFKSWFEGFTEGLEGQPSKKQWERICKRVAEIDGRPVAPVYVERWRDWYPYGVTYPLGTVAFSGSNSIPVSDGSNVVKLTSAGAAWVGTSDIMRTVGKEDAAELASSG